MDTVEKNRLSNCRLIKLNLCDDKISVFADKVDRQQNQISTLIGKNPQKAIGKKLARHFERAFSLSDGSLDLPVDNRNSPIDDGPLKSWESAIAAEGHFELIQADNSMISSDHLNRSIYYGDILEFRSLPAGSAPKVEGYYLYKLDSSEIPVFGQHYESSDGFKIHFLNNSRLDITSNESNPGTAIAELTGMRVKITSST